MSKTIVGIPDISKETWIVSSINPLLSVVAQTEASDAEIVLWDFAQVHHLHPFFIAPLAIYKTGSEKKIECVNIPLHIQSYLNAIYFDRMLHFEDDCSDDILTVLSHYNDNQYLPLCSFAMTNANKDAFGSALQRVIIKQAQISSGVVTPICYFISELLDNIFEHSGSPKGYVFSQYMAQDNMLYLCIADAGITIFKNYKKAGLYQQEIGTNEATALWLANEGYSTKNRPEAENRGYGISTSKRMLVEGLGGAFYMISGRAFHKYELGSENCYVNMSNLFKWDGTMVLMRIPTEAPTRFNYIDYLE